MKSKKVAVGTVRSAHAPIQFAALESTAGFGQWSYDTGTGLVHLSGMAAELMGVQHKPALTFEEACVHVLPDDLPCLQEFTSDLRTRKNASISHEFRVIDSFSGIRWLRSCLLPSKDHSSRALTGILLDITESKHAAIREKLGFQLTEYLVGSHALGETITNVIQLICRNLGWEWGAYWAMDELHPAGPHLVCTHRWHQTNYDVGAFSGASAELMMAPGMGLIGRVWETGSAEWVEDMATDPRFLRRASARDCGLWSGYIFPVTYVSDNGEHHRPGVLEFYSSLSRQPDAQLPKLSATIGALIAQTTKRIEHAAIIHRLAHIDELTELANRSHFYAQLNKKCAQSQQDGSEFGLMFIDLDRFKPINDAFGHEAGNEVLREFAQRLRDLAPAGSVIGRLGGDEFALLLPFCQDESLTPVVDAVLAAARTPFFYRSTGLTVSASIGVSCFPENGRSGPELLRSADAAMYRVKLNGRNGCDVFSHSTPSALAQQSASLAQRLTTEAELHLALQNRSLFLVYQPIFDTASHRLHGVEALIRWRKADGTLVPPDVFIPIAEQSHLIVDIGQWVAMQACHDLQRLQRAGASGLKMHINMAASEFTNHDLPQTLQALVQSLGILPSSLVLELTESMLMKQPETVVAIMHRLREMGFDISLDDFGMGHSSLSLLKNLPITSMKLDRSFVRDLPTHTRDRSIAQTIIDLGRHLNIDVIAEGVELPAQLNMLQALGCHLTQGYLLARPMNLQDLLVVFPAGAVLGSA